MIEKENVDSNRSLEEDICLDNQEFKYSDKNKLLKRSTNVSTIKNETCYSSCEIEILQNSDNNISNKLLILEEIRNDSSLLTYKFSFIIGSFFLLLLITVLKGSEYFNSIIGIKRYFHTYVAVLFTIG